MIEIDRTSPLPVHTQLINQLRYELSGGRYRIGETLPSTRALAGQLDVSFHTVRKVYQDLEREGFLSAKPGVGYVVADRAPVRHEDRMERGAAIVHDALKRLLGLGLNDADIRYLIDEQQSLIDASATTIKMVAAAPYLEMAERWADQLADMFQLDAEPASLTALASHSDADYVVVSYRDVGRAMRAVGGADVIGVSSTLSVDLLDAAARLDVRSTMALVVRDADAVPPLMQDIRTTTGFGGQIVGITLDERLDDVAARLRDVDLIAATSSSRRRLRGRLGASIKIFDADPLIDHASLERLRTTVPH